MIAEVECEDGADLSQAMETSGISQEFNNIVESHIMVLNTHLIIIPTSNNVDTRGCMNNYTHFAFKNKDNEYDLEKPLYDFLGGILERIDQEAANFADEKNEGLIITLADINIDEEFTTLKNRRNARKYKSLGDMLLLRGKYEEAIQM